MTQPTTSAWKGGEAGRVTAFPAERTTWGRDIGTYVLVTLLALGTVRSGPALAHLGGPLPWLWVLALPILCVVLAVASYRLLSRPGTWLAVRPDGVETGPTRVPWDGHPIPAALTSLADTRDPRRVAQRVPFEDVARWETHPDGLLAVLDHGDPVGVRVPADRRTDVLCEITPAWTRVREALADRPEDAKHAREALVALVGRDRGPG